MFSAGVVLSFLLASPQAVPTPQDTVDAAGVERGEVTQVQKTEEDIEDMGFMERRAAFSLNDDLHPSIEDDLLPFFLGGLCSIFGGPLWLPLLLLDDQPNEYFEEAGITWLIWAAVLVAGNFVSFVPYIGWAFGFIWCPTALVISFYLMPVNVANAWDRAAKVYGMKDGGGKKRKKKRKQRRDDDDGVSEEGVLYRTSSLREPVVGMAY